eukprot:s336_g4.t1
MTNIYTNLHIAQRFCGIDVRRFLWLFLWLILQQAVFAPQQELSWLRPAISCDTIDFTIKCLRLSQAYDFDRAGSAAGLHVFKHG